MRKSSRVLLTGVVVEVLLAGIALFLWLQLPTAQLAAGVTAGEAARTIGSAIGSFMGVLAVVIAVAFLVLRRREMR